MKKLITISLFSLLIIPVFAQKQEEIIKEYTYKVKCSKKKALTIDTYYRTITKSYGVSYVILTDGISNYLFTYPELITLTERFNTMDSIYNSNNKQNYNYGYNEDEFYCDGCLDNYLNMTRALTIGIENKKYYFKFNNSNILYLNKYQMIDFKQGILSAINSIDKHEKKN